MNESKSVQLFDESAGALALAQNDAAAVARATQEIQAALVIAQRAPRDEIKLRVRILEACKRYDLAQVAEYEYSRGGTKITGPTIDLLRAIANRWGNIRHGWTETERYNGVSSVRAFAWDMQTNTQAERTFKVKHWRDTREGGYELKDERDIYELLANAAARRVRACLEEVIDSDVVNAAVDQCRLTLKTGAGKELLKDRAVGMVEAFREFNVSQEMMEVRLGNKLEAISENQFASLKRVYKSLRDGVGKVEDYFKPATSAPKFDPDETKPPVAETKPAPATEPDKSAFNPLKALRFTLAAGGIREGELLKFWAQTGATDGSHASLEEVQIAQPKVIEDAINTSFLPVAEKIKEMRGGR